MYAHTTSGQPRLLAESPLRFAVIAAVAGLALLIPSVFPCPSGYAVATIPGAWVLLQPIYGLAVHFLRRRFPGDPVQPLVFGPQKAPMGAVLLHGFADSPETWRREAEYLAARGWRIEVPVLSHDADASAWFAETEAAVQRLRAVCGSVSLWGHSMGGATALAASEKLRPDALILWAPFLAPRFGRRLTGGLCRLHRLLFLSPLTPTFFPCERHGCGDPATFYRIRRTVPLHMFLAMLNLQYQAEQARPLCPILVLLSQRDAVVNNRKTRSVLHQAVFLSASNPRSGHALPNASDWKENLENTIQILKQQPGFKNTIHRI